MLQKELFYNKRSLKYNLKCKLYYLFYFYKRNQFRLYSKYLVEKYKNQRQSYSLYTILFERNRQEEYNKYNYRIRDIKVSNLQIQRKALNYRKTIFDKLYKLQEVYRSKY